MKLAASFLFALSLFGQPQSYLLGLPTDPCVGGIPYSIPNSGVHFLTMRYGSQFTCTFTLPDAAVSGYAVFLDFVEVSVAGPGLRVFNVTVNDTPFLVNFDPYAAGATDAGKVVSRAYLGYASDGKVTIRFDTVARSAIVSRVTITPTSIFAPVLPFTVTDTSIDFGSRSILVSGITSKGVNIMAITPSDTPHDTVINGVAQEMVLYIDRADGKLKTYSKDGKIAVWGLVAVPQSP